jgi:hypothetical protein
MEHRMADDKIPVKEGILLDREGEPVLQQPTDFRDYPGGGGPRMRVRVFRPSIWMLLGLILMMPLFLAAGAAIALAVLAAVLLFSIVGWVLRLGRR